MVELAMFGVPVVSSRYVFDDLADHPIPDRAEPGRLKLVRCG